MRRPTIVLLGAAPLLVTAAALAQVTGVTGGGQPINNLQPSLGLTHLVRITGDFADVGEIRLFGGNFAPSGYALAEGQVLAVAQNQALFTKIGTTYGGNGQTTFALPDLRGRTAVGIGQGPGLTVRELGASFGAEAVILSEAQMPAHVHSASSPYEPFTGISGGSQAHDTMQPSLGLNYTVRIDGSFPSQGNGSAADDFLGQVQIMAAPNVPTGANTAQGQLLPINGNEALFTLIGTTYGGDGQSNFGLPNLSGRVAVGAGQGSGIGARFLGEEFGSEAVALTVDQMPAHSHTLPPPGGGATGVAGGSQPHGTSQPSLGLTYLIATDAAFPAQDGFTADATFLGEVGLFAGGFEPTGWDIADGRLLSVATNPALFALIGTTYGGDGQTTFALPDLRGVTALGVGQGPGLSDRFLGETAGAEFLTLTVGQLPEHAHALVVVPEPTTAILGGLMGGIGLTARRRRR